MTFTGSDQSAPSGLLRGFAAAGQESTRKLRITTLEVQDEDVGDKSLVIFDSPRDIDGTALLSHAKILEPDELATATVRSRPRIRRQDRLSNIMVSS